MEHESDGDTNCNRCTRYSQQRIGTGTGGLEIKRMSGDYPNYSIVEIDQNTKKNPWRLEETCCLSDSSGKPSVYAGVKSYQKSKIINKSSWLDIMF